MQSPVNNLCSELPKKLDIPRKPSIHDGELIYTNWYRVAERNELVFSKFREFKNLLVEITEIDTFERRLKALTYAL